MRKFGLIGCPLGHSWSKRWFDATFAQQGLNDCCFNLYELPNLNNFRDWVEHEELKGFSVTIPYKEQIIPFLDELDEAAAAIGAVNSVAVRQGRLVGYNTDAPGFGQTLRPHLQPWHERALVLGTGGASKAVGYELGRLGIEHRFVSRNPGQESDVISYEQAYCQTAECLLIVNTTPVGMYPHIEATPWQRPDLLTDKHLCYDLVYNPEQTQFLKEASQRNAQVANGLPMLHLQAQLSWSIWNESSAE